MNYEQVAKEIYKAAHVTGEFRLRSGQISNEYFDKYMFEAEPKLLDAITEIIKGSIPKGTEVLAGLELGGVPIAAVLSQKTGIPMCQVRKRPKEYGTCKIAEGAAAAGKRVCIVEDVVTTGGAIIDGVAELRKQGALIDTVICVILRDEKAKEILAGHGLKLIPGFTYADLLKFKGERK